jgi:glutamate dehydrogenase/leucine dehydrogenase
VAGFPRGGGKAVIDVPPDFEPAARDGLLRRYGALVHELGGRFLTGPDVGTSPRDMDVISETGAPWVFGRTEARGGTGGSGGWTALGVFVSIETACERLFGSRALHGRRVVVQGAGSVGGDLARRLAEAGASVEVADSDPAAAARAGDDRRIAVVPAAGALERPCDVFAPCALGGVLDAVTIPRLQCRAVVGAANNQLAVAGLDVVLADRGVLYAPDFVVNSGGIINVAEEFVGYRRERALTRAAGIEATTVAVFEHAREHGLTPQGAAERMARRRITEEGQGRRWQPGDPAGWTNGEPLRFLRPRAAGDVA